MVRAGARKHWVCLAVLCFAFAVHGAELRSRCINITSPLSNYSLNTQMLQAALDRASTSGSDDQLGCVSISGGDFPVKKLDVGSNTWLRIEPGARLVNVINVTRTAVVHVLQARHVLLEGGGTIYGNAERAIVDLAHGLANGKEIADLRYLRGTAFSFQNRYPATVSLTQHLLMSPEKSSRC